MSAYGRNASDDLAYAARTKSSVAKEALQEGGGCTMKQPDTTKAHHEQPTPGKRRRHSAQHSTRILRRRLIPVSTSNNNMQRRRSCECSVEVDSGRHPSDGQRGPDQEVSSGREEDCAGCSSARLAQGSTALQRLASIALKL